MPAGVENLSLGDNGSLHKKNKRNRNNEKRYTWCHPEAGQSVAGGEAERVESEVGKKEINGWGRGLRGSWKGPTAHFTWFKGVGQKGKK